VFEWSLDFVALYRSDTEKGGLCLDPTPPRGMVYICSNLVISCLAYVRPGDEKICRHSVFSCLSTKPTNTKILGQNFEKLTGTKGLLYQSPHKAYLRSIKLYTDLNLSAQYR